MSEKIPYTAPDMEIFGAPDSRGDLISRETAKEFARHAWAKGLNVVEYLDEVPAVDSLPTDKLTKDAKLLLKHCPELINSLAARLIAEIDKTVLFGAWMH